MLIIKNSVRIIVMFFLFTGTSYAMKDMTVYAESDGTYTYLNKNYTLKEFPLDTVLTDLSSGENGPTVDSVIPITVNIFPVDNVDIHNLKKFVRPLAVQFHRRDAKVNTRFLNNIIPYIFKKPEYFKK